MEKTIINIKTDKKLKEEARKTARDLGLPLGTIINAYLRDLVREKRVVFSAQPKLNARTLKTLEKVEHDLQQRKNMDGPFATEKEMKKYLDSLKK